MTIRTSFKFFTTLIVSVSLVAQTHGAQPAPAAQLTWDATSDPSVAGYMLYYGTATGDYISNVDVGGTNVATVAELFPGLTYYFVVAAYDSAGDESDLSNEVILTAPGNASTLTLALIPNQSAIVGRPLSITPTALDSISTATLTFNLGAGTPDGATVDPATGIVSWTPTFSQAGTTNQIVLQVADDSDIEQSTSETVIVVVAPVIQAAQSQVAFINSTDLVPEGLQASGGQQNSAFGLGLEFTVNTQIVISQLGAYDATIGRSGTGFSTPVQVGIFNEATHSFVSPPVTFSRNAGTTVNSYRFQAIAPLTLSPGKYMVVASGYGISTAPDWNAVVAGASSSPIKFNDGAGALTAGRNFYANNQYSLDSVNLVDSGPYPQYAAGTFTYTAAVTQPVPVQLSNVNTSGGVFSFSIPSVSGFKYIVQQSSDLTITDWITVTNLTGTGSAIPFNALVDRSAAQVFYRVMHH